VGAFNENPLDTSAAYNPYEYDQMNQYEGEGMIQGHEQEFQEDFVMDNDFSATQHLGNEIKSIVVDCDTQTDEL